MIDYNNLPRHEASEAIVNAIAQKVGTTHTDFFRLHVGYYFAVMAASLRTSINVPGVNNEPVNIYAMNLAPSGFGKGYSTSIIEKQVIGGFQQKFMETTFPEMAENNLPIIATARYKKKSELQPDEESSYEEELAKVQAEFASYGPILFNFDSATGPAIKQLRNTLLMARAGALNLQTDEIGANLTNNTEALNSFLELYSGEIKPKLIKHTNESRRGQQLFGQTPTNMMLFGVQATLLDGGASEEATQKMFLEGYARRLLFGFVDEDSCNEKIILSPQEQLALAKAGNADTVLNDYYEQFTNLCNAFSAHKTLEVSDATALLYFEYKNHCEERANKLKKHQQVQKTEVQHRFFKTLKLAGAYSFVDQLDIISEDNLLAAIRVAEESGRAFDKILNREKSYVSLAKFLGDIDYEVTQTDLVEKLPYYRGSRGAKDELIQQATAWGYRNSIIIRKRFVDTIEFFSGESLVETDLEDIKISYSSRITEGYTNASASFKDLHQFTQAEGFHWVNHHLLDGDKEEGYRKDEFIVPGFNLIAIDVDNGIKYEVAKQLLDGYSALFYKTKSHTEANHRFRILLPTNYVLNLDSADYKEFMKNVFEWFPFDSDTQTGQRSRKWQTHPNQAEYIEGKSFDVLPFIPRSTKNDLRIETSKKLHSLDALERWVIQNTYEGNRNNQLLKYAMILVDSGKAEAEIQTAVLALNEKLSDSIDTLRIAGTIFKTVKVKLKERDA